jgi:hypothetical protein
MFIEIEINSTECCFEILFCTDMEFKRTLLACQNTYGIVLCGGHQDG